MFLHEFYVFFLISGKSKRIILEKVPRIIASNMFAISIMMSYTCSRVRVITFTLLLAILDFSWSFKIKTILMTASSEFAAFAGVSAVGTFHVSR